MAARYAPAARPPYLPPPCPSPSRAARGFTVVMIWLLIYLLTDSLSSTPLRPLCPPQHRQTRQQTTSTATWRCGHASPVESRQCVCCSGVCVRRVLWQGCPALAPRCCRQFLVARCHENSSPLPSHDTFDLQNPMAAGAPSNAILHSVGRVLFSYLQ